MFPIDFTTADFIKKVLSVNTRSMAIIYLSLSIQVAKSTFFMKSPVSLLYFPMKPDSPLANKNEWSFVNVIELLKYVRKHNYMLYNYITEKKQRKVLQKDTNIGFVWFGKGRRD